MDLESTGVLTAIFWLRLTWSDYRLAWNPAEHENITVIRCKVWMFKTFLIFPFRLTPSELWKPDVSLYNKQDLSNGILAADPRSANTNTHIHSNGNILWILPVSHKVRTE